MDKAWVTYDSNLRPLGVSWGTPLGTSVEIDPDLAIEFIHGHRRLEDWTVAEINGVLSLVENAVRLIDSKVPKFWNLKKGDDPNMTISIIPSKNELRIFANGFNTIPLLLFATVKHDPTWLIGSWNLNNYPLHGGRVDIPFEDAENYSYFVDKIS